MATKEAVFSLKVDTGSSVNDIKSFDQAVKGLNKDVNSLQDTVQEGAGTDVFAQKMAELNAKVEAGGLTMREMTQTMKEYQNIAAQAGMDSPIGQQAIAAAGELKDGIGDIKAQVANLSSDFKRLDTAMGALQGGAAVFQGIESAMALAGVEDEKLMQTMVKLQAVQGLMNATNEIANLLNKESIVGMQLRVVWEKAYAMAVGTSSGAMKIFRLALISTGIGALIVALGMIIANWDKVTLGIQKAIKWFNSLGPVMKVVVGFFMPAIWAIQLVIKGMQMLGIIESDEDKKAQAIQQRRMARIDKQLAKERELRAQQKKAFEDGQKAMDREIALAEAAGQSTVELKKKKIQASIDYQKEQIKEIENNMKALDSLMKNNKFMAGIYKEQRDAGKANLDKMKEDIKDSETEKKVIQINANKEAADKAKQAAEKEAEMRKSINDKIQEERNQLIYDLEEAENAYYDSLKTARQLDEDKVGDYYFNLITKAEAAGEDTTTLKLAQAKAEADIKEKYDKIDLQNAEEKYKKQRDALRNYQQYVLNEYELAIVDLDNAQADEKKVLEKNLADKLITQEQYNAALVGLDKKRAQSLKEIEDKRIADAKAAATKEFEEKNKMVYAALEFAKKTLDAFSGLNQAINDIQNARLASMKSETDAQLSEIEKRKQAELGAANLTAEQKDAINKKYAMAAYNLQKKQFDAEEKIKKQQFNRDKALKIASIAINTAEAVMKSVAASPTTGGLPFSAFSAAMGIAQIAAVTAQKYEGGTAPTMPDFNASSGAGASATQLGGGTPNAQQTSLASFLPGGANGPAVSQVVVLESDITGTQQKVATQQALSTY